MLLRSRAALALGFLSCGLSGCAGGHDSEVTGQRASAVLGQDTYLYLRCNNATGWDYSSASRFSPVDPNSGMFEVSFEISQDWQVTSADTCSVQETNQSNGAGTVQTNYGIRGAQLISVPDSRQLLSAGAPFQVRYPRKGRYVARVNWHNGTFSITPVVATQRSLIERNPAAMTGFSMPTTLQRIATNGGVSGGTAWHDAIFKTFQRGFEYPDEPGPFCDSDQTDPFQTGFPMSTINDFPVTCTSSGSGLIGNIDGWAPLAVANRFDLAPEGGEHCGEQRVSFFKRDANTSPSRAFTIFEAVISNPHPELGLEGCRPIVDFWAELSVIADPAQRGSKLTQAFYTGEPRLQAAGFKPFMSFQHFGHDKGRVRTEAFGLAIWEFHEFRLLSGGSVERMPVAQSLPEELFRTPNTVISPNPHPKRDRCQNEFLASLGMLLGTDANAFSIDVSPDCFGGESASFHTRIEDGLSLPEMGDFAARVELRARELDPSAALTAAQIGARAEFAGTCVGCHHRMNTMLSRDMGQNLTLPVVDIPPGEQDIKSFTQVNNIEFEPCAPNGPDQTRSCYFLSPALKEIFLPKRKETIERFLQHPGSFGPLGEGRSSTLTISGAPISRSN